jgi:Rrf2 family protein
MISKKTKYAINALVKLAKEYNKGPILIREISDSENIPLKFLEAILRELKNAGILNSKMGKGGGYYLIKHPDEVHLATVIRLFDGAIGMIPCVTYRYYEPCLECQDEETCGIRSVFKEIRDETVQLLKKATLSEIINRESELKLIYHK